MRLLFLRWHWRKKDTTTWGCSVWGYDRELIILGGLKRVSRASFPLLGQRNFMTVKSCTCTAKCLCTFCLKCRSPQMCMWPKHQCFLWQERVEYILFFFIENVCESDLTNKKQIQKRFSWAQISLCSLKVLWFDRGEAVSCQAVQVGHSYQERKWFSTWAI